MHTVKILRIVMLLFISDKIMNFIIVSVSTNVILRVNENVNLMTIHLIENHLADLLNMVVIPV